MRIAREGIPLIALAALGAAVAGLFQAWLAGAACGALALALLAFFRDPERAIPQGEGLVVAPADGRVVEVAEEVPGRAFEGPACRVSIFLGPWNVHVNRVPVSGTVVGVHYRRGRFRAAFSPKSSEQNECNAVVLRDRGARTFGVVQIAGWVARRIVCRCRPGQEVSRGERYGLIMFGSRVDLYVPPAVGVTVRPGARVRGGETVVGVIR